MDSSSVKPFVSGFLLNIIVLRVIHGAKYIGSSLLCIAKKSFMVWNIIQFVDAFIS